ncbi:MAG: STAS domain-containing protein [Vulcanimicrobiota bacterium]
MNMLLNLEDVDFIDSSSLGAIVAVMKNLGRDGELILCSLQPGVKSLVELTRMHRVFKIFTSEEEAKRAMTL